MRVLRGEVRDDIDLLAFGPGERVAAAAAGRNQVDVWDAATGRQADAWHTRLSTVTDLGFLPDGRVLACVGGHPLQVIDPDQTGRYGTAFPAALRQKAVRVATGGAAVFTASDGRSRPGVVCWRPDGSGEYTAAWLRHGPDGGLPLAVAASPDGRLVAHAELVNPRRAPPKAPPAFVIRAAADGKKILRVTIGVGPGPPGDRLRFSPDGSKLLAIRPAGADLWDATTGESAGHLPTEDPTDAAFHPSGRWLLTSSTDGTVRVWDADRLAEVAAFRWDVGKLRAVAVSPDGALAAAGGADGRVVVWDLDL
jgi:WD40 repeat protein